MVVGCPIFQSNFTHCFRYGLAEADTNLNFLLRRLSGHKLDTSLKFPSKIEQERRTAIGTSLYFGDLTTHQFRLSIPLQEQILQPFNRRTARCFLPYDTGRRKISNGTATVLHLL